MSLTIYHNPACSKSRKTLQIIEEKGIKPEIIEYLKTPPDSNTVIRLAALLGKPVDEILRHHESDYAALVEAAGTTDDAALAAGLSSHPKALERPIVVSAGGDRAVIGRPPENVLELIDG